MTLIIKPNPLKSEFSLAEYLAYRQCSFKVCLLFNKTFLFLDTKASISSWILLYPMPILSIVYKKKNTLTTLTDLKNLYLLNKRNNNHGL